MGPVDFVKANARTEEWNDRTAPIPRDRTRTAAEDMTVEAVEAGSGGYVDSPGCDAVSRASDSRRFLRGQEGYSIALKPLIYLNQHSKLRVPPAVSKNGQYRVVPV